jgi:hypothetical protein
LGDRCIRRQRVAVVNLHFAQCPRFC